MYIKKNMNMIFCSIFLSANLISYSLGNYNYNKIIYLVAGILMVITVRQLVISKSILFMFLYTLLVSFISMIRYDYAVSKGYVIYFLIFSLFSFFALRLLNEDSEIFYTVHSYVLFICSPMFFLVFSTNMDVGSLLGISYAILPNYITSLMSIRASKSISKNLVPLANVLYFGYFYLTKGNRGALLCIVVFFLLKYITREKDSKLLSKVKSIFLIIIVYFGFSNLTIVLNIIRQILSFFNVKIYAIEKTIDLIIQNQNIDSGRLFLLEKVSNEIDSWSNFFIGRGIGYFEHNIGTYTHNLIFQYFIEGGILFTLVPLTLICVLMVFLLKRDKSNINCIILIISSIILPLMLSNVHWVNPYYWLVLNYTLIKLDKIQYIIKIN